MGITVVAPFDVEDDHQSFIINFTGGIKGWQHDKDEWSFGPIIYKGEPVMAGMLSQEMLKIATSAMNLSPVIMEHHVSIGGDSSTTRRSVNPVKQGDPLAATDAWQTISGNITRERMGKFKSENPDHSIEQWGSECNKLTPEENYSAYIADSLRSMDICVNAICDYYHDQLISSLRKGDEIGQKHSSLADLPFIANVHSFFVHLGAARDYLAALIATRCGMSENIDAMNRLVDKLKWEALPEDSLIKTMVEKGVFSRKEGAEKCRISGWLNEVSEVRNELVHKRPFGSHEDEKMGWIKSAGGIKDHYRYWRPINLNGNSETDTIDYISDAYHKTNRLFGDLALVSGYSAKIPHYTDKDFKNLKVIHGKPAKNAS